MAEPKISAIRWAKLSAMEETEKEESTVEETTEEESIWDICATE